jgi:hypothetical protein
MKIKLLPGLALVLSGVLCGCTTARTTLTHSSSIASADSFGGYDFDGHHWGIEGEVIRIHKTATVLNSITVKLIKPLPTALGYVPYETPGEIIVIRFDESLSKLESLRVKPGNIVRVELGQGFGNDPKNTANPASNFSWLTVERDGSFYNTEGEKVEYEDLQAEDLPLSILRAMGVEFWKLDLQSDPDETVSVSLVIKDSNGSVEWLEKDVGLPWTGLCPVVVVLRPNEKAGGKRSISLLVGGNGGVLSSDYPDWGHSTEIQPKKLGNGEYLLEEAYSPEGGNNRDTKKLMLVVKRWRNGKPE